MKLKKHGQNQKLELLYKKEIEMNKVEMQVKCSACMWNQMCVSPPAMTTAEVEALVKKEELKMKEGKPEEAAIGTILTAMFFGGKDTEGRLCPVFAERLREGPELTNKIKEIMKAQ